MLDYAPPLKNPKNGRPQRFEFLDLFTYEKPANRSERQHHSETNTLAENIRAQRQLDIQNSKYGFKADRDRSGNFVEYFKTFTRSKQKSTSDNIAMSYRYFVEFIGYDLTFYNRQVPDNRLQKLSAQRARYQQARHADQSEYCSELFREAKNVSPTRL
jgi:hypothetical protein